MSHRDYRSLYLAGERSFEIGRATSVALALAKTLVEDCADVDDVTWIDRKIGKRTQDVAARLRGAADRTANHGFSRLAKALGDYAGMVVRCARSGHGAVVFDRSSAYDDERELFAERRNELSISDDEALNLYVSHRGWQTGFSFEYGWIEIWASAGIGPETPPPPYHTHVLVLGARLDDPPPTDQQLAVAAGRSVDTIRKLRRSHMDLTTRSAIVGGEALKDMFRRIKEDADRAALLPRGE